MPDAFSIVCLMEDYSPGDMNEFNPNHAIVGDYNTAHDSSSKRNLIASMVASFAYTRPPHARNNSRT
jgi:hypothetical protein